MKLARLAKSSTLIQQISIVSAITLSFSSSIMAQDIDLDSSEGQAGYAIGVNIGMNLLNQGILDDVDNASLMGGITDAMNSEIKNTEEDRMAAIQEFSLLQQNKAQVEFAEQAQAGLDFLETNGAEANVTTTASGLQYLVMTEASDSNAAMPEASDTVNVHYHGTLIDGTVFDSSVDRGEPISFPLNGVIPGWTEGLQLMQVGEKFRFFIPPDLAYGASGAGAIGPNSTLIFEVELLGIE